KDADRDAVRGPFGERVAETRADLVRPEDVSLEVHGLPGGGDGREHGGKDRVAVLEKLEPVAARHRRSGQRGRQKRRRSQREVVRQLVDGLLRGTRLGNGDRERIARRDRNNDDRKDGRPLWAPRCGSFHRSQEYAFPLEGLRFGPLTAARGETPAPSARGGRPGTSAPPTSRSREPPRRGSRRTCRAAACRQGAR